MSAALLIMLHGVGARGGDLHPVGMALLQALPGARLAAPDAPQRFDLGADGRQWFSVAGVTPANRPTRIAAARAAFDQVIDDLVQSAGNPGRVILAGFSQGSIMALDALARGRAREVIAFSGRLPLSGPATPAEGARALLVHWAEDPVIAADESGQAAAALSAAGCDIDLLVLPGLGHAISAEAIAAGRQFLRAD